MTKEAKKKLKTDFDSVIKLVESLGDNGFESVVWCGKEFTVGINGDGRMALLVPHRGNLYYNTLEHFISDLFRLALGDDWTENILWD